MSSDRRIPIPLRHRIRRFQYSVMPAVIFLVSVLLTCWLWDRQGRMPNALGEVEAERVPVVAGVDGTLLHVGPPGTDRTWELFEPVEQGQVVAELDPELDEALLTILDTDLRQLVDAVDAAVVTYNLDRANLKHEHEREARRLTWEIERRRLEKVRLEVLIAVDHKEIDRIDSQLRYLLPLFDREVVTKEELETVKLEKIVVQTRIDGNDKALAEVDDQLQRVQEASGRYPPLPEGEEDALLAPCRQAVDVQLATIAELKLRMKKTLKIRAPISGRICVTVSRPDQPLARTGQHVLRPGQQVLAGEPILTIASDDGRYVVSYIRQAQGLRPTVGMLADLRVRAPGRPRHEDLRVVDVGPQYEQIPLHLLQDPRIMEWGLPVLIAMPEDKALKLRPGELVDVSFKPWTAKAAGD